MRLLALLLAVGACTTPRTEVVIGIATDIRVGTVDRLKLDILRQGVITFDVPAWEIEGPNGGGMYELPASFGVYSDDGSETQIEVKLHGRKGDTTGDVVLRQAVFTLKHEQTLYLRMALTQSCVNVWMTCNQDTETCIEGACKPEPIDSATFNPYFGGEENFQFCPSPANLIDPKTLQALSAPPAGTVMPPCTTCVERACYK